MKMTVQLKKHLPNVVGINVSVKEIVVGKIIEYNIDTGMTTIEIDDDAYSKIGWNPIVGNNIGIISRDKSEDE